MPNAKRVFLSISSTFLFVIALTLLAYVYLDRLVVNKIYSVDVSGTGSMYPTFDKTSADNIVASPALLAYPNGLVVNGEPYFRHKLVLGDIVSFTNKKTTKLIENEHGKETGFIKRVIATAGDILELREGLVRINGKPIKEPYIALPHSTFGGDFLKECQSLVVPDGKVFVMGDNRKGSNDSRFDLGLVDEKDIEGVITIEMQKQDGLTKNWRDTSKDFDPSTKIKLAIEDFLKKLNEKRKENKLPEVKRFASLDKSAELRATSIFETADFKASDEARSISLAQSNKLAGYKNVLTGEIPIQGYFDSDELLENFLAFDSSRNFILKAEYTDIGISVEEGELNDCPTQLIVVHMGGYVPPSYSADVIKSWEKLASNLKEVGKGWKDLTDVGTFYKENKSDIDRLIDIIDTREQRANSILLYMYKNEWLPEDLDVYARAGDTALATEQQDLSEKINKNIEKFNKR